MESGPCTYEGVLRIPAAWRKSGNSGQLRTTMTARLEFKRRAYRFAVHLPLTYKHAGGKDWFEGKTENMSHSGVLFRTDHPLEPNTRIQMRVSVLLPGIGVGRVLCRGIVVRTVPAHAPKSAAMAATIESYHFARGQREN